MASFFVSRIDTAIDAQIDARLPILPMRACSDCFSRCGARWRSPTPSSFQRYQELFATHGGALPRAARRRSGCLGQHGTKNASYRDVVYVEELIGPDTVNTIPPRR